MGGNVEQAEFPQHSFDHTIEVLTNFPVPASKHLIAARLEPLSSLGVGDRVARLAMLDAIHFDDEFSFETYKINDIFPKRMLAAKPEAHGSTFAQVAPQKAFFIRHVGAQMTCKHIRHFPRNHSHP